MSRQIRHRATDLNRDSNLALHASLLRMVLNYRGNYNRHRTLDTVADLLQNHIVRLLGGAQGGSRSKQLNSLGVNSRHLSTLHSMGVRFTNRTGMISNAYREIHL